MLYENFKVLLAPVYDFIGSGFRFLAAVVLLVLIVYFIRSRADKRAWDKHKSDPCVSTNKWWSWEEYEKECKKVAMLKKAALHKNKLTGESIKTGNIIKHPLNARIGRDGAGICRSGDTGDPATAEVSTGPAEPDT